MRTILKITIAAILTSTAAAKIGWTKSKFVNTYGKTAVGKNAWKVGNVSIRPAFDGFGKCKLVRYSNVTASQAIILAKKQDRSVTVGGSDTIPVFTSKFYTMTLSGGELTIAKK